MDKDLVGEAIKKTLLDIHGLLGPEDLFSMGVILRQLAEDYDKADDHYFELWVSPGPEDVNAEQDSDDEDTVEW